MSLWWLQPGWTETCCSQCGSQIAPEGDPDWGMCFPCFTDHLRQQEEQQQSYEAEERRQLENEEMARHFERHPHG